METRPRVHFEKRLRFAGKDYVVAGSYDEETPPPGFLARLASGVAWVNDFDAREGFWLAGPVTYEEATDLARVRVTSVDEPTLWVEQSEDKRGLRRRRSALRSTDRSDRLDAAEDSLREAAKVLDAVSAPVGRPRGSRTYRDEEAAELVTKARRKLRQERIPESLGALAEAAGVDRKTLRTWESLGWVTVQRRRQRRSEPP